MGKKRKAEADEADLAPDVLDAHSTEGFWQEFGPSFEHLRASKAIVVVTLDRATGLVEVDDTLSTPMETYGALMIAHNQHDASVDRVNGALDE